MSEKMSEVYEAYDIEIKQTSRGRGATILKTDKGILQLRPLDVNESRLQAEYSFKEKLVECGFENIDACIKNTENELVTYDRYGNPYVMRKYFEGREMSVNSREEIEQAVDNLANLHIAGRTVFKSTENDVHIRSNENFRKRNQELWRVKNYMLQRKPRREFEDVFLKCFDKYYSEAVECEKLVGRSGLGDMENHIGYCHGMYNNHSILIEEEGRVCTVGFEKFHVGNQLTDLYHFTRKVVEKNNYSFELLKLILERYSETCPISASDIEYIYILYMYPEKYYKLCNQYMNAPKNWISPKMLDKINKLIEDDEKKQKLLCNLKKLFV